MRRDTPIQVAYFQALRRGLSDKEATNVVAILFGVHVLAKQQWTMPQLEHLLFLRHQEDQDHPEHSHEDEPEVPPFTSLLSVTEPLA